MPQQYFINLRFAVPEESFDLSYSVFNDYAIQGIEEGFDSLLVSFREEDTSAEMIDELCKQLQQFIPTATLISSERIEQQNWNASWEQSLEPVVLSERIVISPSWKAHEQTHPVCVIIDPKMSFGTGYHPTTRMTARLVEELVEAGTEWMDAGTGTGVLAIIAAKLGASSVFAFDNDEWSVENAAENLERNGVQQQVRLEEADIFRLNLPTVDGIAANMYRTVLIPTFPKLHEALRLEGQPLIVSGILQYDEQEVIDAARAAGFRHELSKQEDEWLAILFRKA